MNCRWVVSAAAIVAIATLGIAIAAAPALPPVPVPAGADWEGYNKSLDGQRYSTLDQINVGNAANLREVCRVRIAVRGNFQSGLVVVGDLLYATTATETMALDPVNCAVKWHHTYRRAQDAVLQGNRGVAYLNGRVFRGTDDARLFALDAVTGKEIWSNVVGDPVQGEYVVAAPVAWNGMVIVGISGSELGIRGRIMAFDALTGRELWRFHTIPAGDSTGADTWGDRKWSDHGGGGTWSTLTIDPRTAELFVPVGNPVPDFAPMDRKGANLFTNSVLVLDANTGALKWWYQLQANDDHDHDLAAAPVLLSNAQHEPLVAAAGKDGLLHIIDRATHQARFRVPVTTVDNPRKPATPEGARVCPGASAGVMWNGPAFDPKRTLLFTGAIDQCMVIKSTPGTLYVPRAANFGGSYSATGEPMTGWVTAVDANTGTVRWKYHAESAVVGGVTPTAGGVVMTGDNAGNFLVFESDTGRLLKKENTGGAIAGGVVTYWRGGRQYVAFTSGNISPTGLGSAGRPSVVVMALPQARVPATAAGTAAADAGRGKTVYGQVCAGCHGPDGDRIADKQLKAAVARMDAAQLARAIANPAGVMPKIFPAPRTAEDERDLGDVTAYLAGGMN
jgi:alcohol dehydrogenase (cytochrome c)